MHLFLTSVLPFLAHDHPSAAAFLTCRHHNFHASIIPEFLSDEERVKTFCETRQKDQIDKLPSFYNPDEEKQFRNLYNLFVQTPLMQFSPSLVLHQENKAESILNSLLGTKYFTRTLQRCFFRSFNTDPLPANKFNHDLLHDLSKVQSLAELDLGSSEVENEHLETIVNSFPSLETLMIRNAEQLKTVDPNTAISVSSPPPPAIKTLRSLRFEWVDPLFAVQFFPYFPNLRKLVLRARSSSHPLNLLPLSSSLPLLKVISLEQFNLENTESLKNLVHLSSIEFHECGMPDSLSFLTQNSLPELSSLSLLSREGLSTSAFASLAHASNLHVLEIDRSEFDNDCLQYLENMVHLRKLDLKHTFLTGDSRSLKTLMQNLFQLEQLNLYGCRDIGGQGAIAGALYSTHSRLRVLNLNYCGLVDDDLNGIGALKNTLEVLDVSCNYANLTSEGLRHCKDLVKLKILDVKRCGIDDISPLKDCLNLEELDVRGCVRLSDDALKVFREDPNSFPNLRVLDLWYCQQLTEKAFEHLSKNNHLVYQLKQLNVEGMSKILLSSSSARNNIYQLKGLKRLTGFFSGVASESERKKLKDELLQRLKNLEQLE